MLERVDQDTKKKFQVIMSEPYIEKLRQYSFRANMAQGKFIELLIDKYEGLNSFGEAVLQEAIDRVSVELEKFNSMEEAYGLERAVEILKKLREDVQNPSVHF